MSYDSVRVDPAAASAALQRWQASVDGLHLAVRRSCAALDAAEAARPWGGDSSGQQFGTVYAEGAAPSRAAVDSTAGDLDRLGHDVRTAVQASVASDDGQAAALGSAQAALDPR